MKKNVASVASGFNELAQYHTNPPKQFTYSGFSRVENEAPWSYKSNAHFQNKNFETFTFYQIISWCPTPCVCWTTDDCPKTPCDVLAGVGVQIKTEHGISYQLSISKILSSNVLNHYSLMIGNISLVNITSQLLNLPVIKCHLKPNTGYNLLLSDHVTFTNTGVKIRFRVKSVTLTF